MRNKWTLEKVKEEALKYSKKSDFFKNSGSAYNKARNLGILDEVCSHMEESKNAPWSMEELRQEALKYKTRVEFQKNSPNIYKTCFKKKILDEVCAHMIVLIKSWTLEELQEEALKYQNKRDFSKYSSKAYSVARQRGVMNQICSHMVRLIREDWTNEELRSEALKYKSRWEFQQLGFKAYKAAYKRDLLDQICQHMLPATNTSISEKDLFHIIKSIYPKAQKLVDRKASIPNEPHIQGFDVDIYIPELRKGIEFDGKYHHSFQGLKRGRPNWSDESLHNYHKIKDDYFLSKGIELLHIKEEDWLKYKQVCIDKCLEFLKIMI